MLKLKAIEVEQASDKFLLPIFVRPKKNGEYRVVLNLKDLNEYVLYQHFKMDTFQQALTLITKGTYMASVDLRHAISVKFADEHQKYLCFCWNGNTYQSIYMFAKCVIRRA